MKEQNVNNLWSSTQREGIWNDSKILHSETLISELEVREKQLEELANLLARTIREAPPGNIRITHYKGCPRYYYRSSPSDKSGVYMNKDRLSEAALIAQRCYDEKLLELTLKELKMVREFLQSLRQTAEMLPKIYDNLSPDRRKLTNRRLITDEEYAESWLNREYEPMPFRENAPSFLTARGEMVRSKSELIIANTLNRYHIPYLYEYPLYVAGRKKRPDFTALVVRNREEKVWEHFGLMDDREYREAAFSKLSEYMKNGLFPGKNLIVTFETSSAPI